MRHLEYRIDYNGKRAILQSRNGVIECVDLSTDFESSFSPDERDLILNAFMVAQYLEFQGKNVRDYIPDYHPRITPEQARAIVDLLEQEHQLKPFTFADINRY